MPEKRGYTREELLKMGGKPAPKGFTREQLEAMKNTPAQRTDSVAVGGVPVRYSDTANKLFQPNLSSNPVIGAAQQIGANFAKGLFDVGAGALKGGVETVRQVGQLGGAIQTGVTAATGISGQRTTAFDEGGAIDKFTTPQGPLQKAGYAGETAAEIIPAGGKIALAATKPILKATGRGVEKLVAENIPKPVETALKSAPRETFDRYAEAAVKASESYKNPTPLELAGQRAEESLDTIQRKLSTIGSQKSAVIEKAAVGNKPVGNIAVKFRQNLGNYLSGKTATEGDSTLYRTVMSEAQKLGANPKAKDVDKFIDFVQEQIYTSQRNLTVPVTDEGTAALRKMVGELNESLKNELPESYRTLNSQYSDMVGIRNELNMKLGKDGERGGALMKRVFSPSDANTKKLFAEVEKLTGVDLIDEATLARYTMEAAGDARQASLLEQLQLPRFTKEGILDWLYKKATARFNTPEMKLERARELTLPPAK